MHGVNFQSLLVSKETWARFLPKVIAIVSVCEGEPTYVIPVFSSTFLAELLLCYLTGNILGLKSCHRQHADDIWMMYG